LTTDQEISRTQIAGEPDAIWYSSGSNALYVAIGNPGVVDVLDTRTLAVVRQVSTGKGAHTTAFDSKRRRLYVFLPATAQAAVFDEARSVPV
jgi:DNA-binding beta-propeller fold protein YncE